MTTRGTGQSLQLQAGLQTELRALPGLLNALGMLAMTQEEVTAATERSLAENPVLERTDGHPCPGCGRHVSSGTCYRCRGAGTTARFGEQAEPAADPFRTLEADARLEVRSDCRTALDLVIAHLTPRGILDADPDEIADTHGLGLAQVDEAIRALQVVGPAGIAATSVTDLLTAQAESLVEKGQVPAWLPHLVSEHLSDLAAGSTAAVVRATGLPEDQVLAGLAIIKERLRPYVAVETEPTDTPVPTADVFLYSRPDGSLEVEVPASTWFGLTVADLSAGVPASSEARQWLAEHELAAQRLIYQIDRRANALLRITECAVAYQKDFLNHGAGHHRPLTRTAVAEEIGLHASTVSRAVGGKRLRLPSGSITDLSCLFGKGQAPRAALHNLLAAAPRGMSDERLRKELARNGFVIARRTVNKYRRSL